METFRWAVEAGCSWDEEKCKRLARLWGEFAASIEELVAARAPEIKEPECL